MSMPARAAYQGSDHSSPSAKPSLLRHADADAGVEEAAEHDVGLRRVRLVGRAGVAVGEVLEVELEAERCPPGRYW
jgi:hypothetical protein